MSRSQQSREGFLSTLRRIICRLLCRDQPCPPPPPPQPPTKRSIRSFEPGQVAILVEYPPQLELTPRQIVDRVAARLDKLNIDRREKVLLAPERVIILRGRQLTLATVFGDVPAARQDPARLIRFISLLHRTIKKPPLEGRPAGQGPEPGPKDYPPAQNGPAQQSGGEAGSPLSTSGSAQLAATTAPAHAARTLTPDPDGFDLRAASPNWYASGAKDFIGGGPGAWPVAGAGTASPAVPQPWAFSLPAALQPAILGPVEVAILDTVPRMIDLRHAHATWVGDGQTQPTQALNPLLKSLLSNPADGSFNVVDQSFTPDTVGTQEQLDVIYLHDSATAAIDEHPYQMASHGLFIAGIIRSIAPTAKLRLIQVLDDEGGGSLLSVTQGLAYANHPTRSIPLVINCSFAMRTPRLGDPPDAQDLETVLQSDIDELTQLLSDQFALTNQSLDLAIVAAAGNHGGGLVHPPARYPAAFPFVAGVAALKQDDNNALTPPELNEYSDLSDDQPAEGFAAFGGEQSSSAPALADSQKGMLGVFIEPLPIFDSVSNSVITEPNSSGWARWAGTSFAAPIVSAVAANLIAGGILPLDVIPSLDTLLDDIGVRNTVPAQQP